MLEADGKQQIYFYLDVLHWILSSSSLSAPTIFYLMELYVSLHPFVEGVILFVFFR